METEDLEKKNNRRAHEVRGESHGKARGRVGEEGKRMNLIKMQSMLVRNPQTQSMLVRNPQTIIYTYICIYTHTECACSNELSQGGWYKQKGAEKNKNRNKTTDE